MYADPVARPGPGPGEPPSCAHARSERSERYNLHLTRQGLRKMLLDRLSPDCVRWGHRVRDIEPDESGVTLHFNGPDCAAFRADVVVGCDGIWSTVRQIVRGGLDAPPRYLGLLVVLGIVESKHPLNHERIYQTVDGTTRLYAMPYTAGEAPSTMWQLSFPAVEAEAKRLAASPQLLLDEAIRRCGHWHSPIPTMLRTTSPSLVMGTPVYDRDPLPPEPLVVAPRFQHPRNRRVTLMVGPERAELGRTHRAQPGRRCAPNVSVQGAGRQSSAPGRAGPFAQLGGTPTSCVELNATLTVALQSARTDALTDALGAFEASMFQRAGSKVRLLLSCTCRIPGWTRLDVSFMQLQVLASRKTAHDLHSEAAASTERLANRGIVVSVTDRLRDAGVGAYDHCAAELDARVRDVLRTAGSASTE
jgi:hypothetical protein